MILRTRRVSVSGAMRRCSVDVRNSSGFAVTLSIGILTSMFTAIMGTRAIVNLIYGGRRVKQLSL